MDSPGNRNEFNFSYEESRETFVLTDDPVNERVVVFRRLELCKGLETLSNVFFLLRPFLLQ